MWARSTRSILAIFTVLAAACGSRAPAPEPARPAGSTLALIRQAQEAETRREYLEAQALYQRAKDTAPDPASRAHAATIYGRALIFYGEYERAAVELEEAAALAPGDAGVWHDLGMVRHHLGQDQAAERALRRAVETAPEDARPRIALAALFMRQSRLAEALEEYRALRELSLPERVRQRVEWAVDTLEKRLAADPGASHPASPTGPSPEEPR